MSIYIGSDHAGFGLKNALREHLKAQGQDVLDLGTFDAEVKVDYPDIAREVAEKVKSNKGSAGVLVCGTGIGVAIAANKVKGILAANVHDVTEFVDGPPCRLIRCIANFPCFHLPAHQPRGQAAG